MVPAARVLRASAQALLLSFACLTLATCGGGGGDGGNGPGTPEIALSGQLIGFSGLVGGANPAAQSVAVTNGGGGSLGGLTTSITYGASEPIGWLNASLSKSSAPSTLTLTGATGILNEGTYTATVEIASTVATNSPRHVDVTFTITPNVATTVPAAPTGLAANAPSSSQINLTWTDNATTESGFRIERCDGAACTGFTEYALVGPNVTGYADGSLPASSTFRYRVQAYNGIGNSAYTGIATGTTQAPAVVIPAAPTALTATAVSSTQINLSWTDNSTNETGFRLEGCAGASCTSFGEFAAVVANVTTYSVTALTNSTDYVFRVRAYNDAGFSAFTNTATAFTPQDPPAPPLGLNAIAASSTQINLSWTDNSTTEIGFRIDRCAGLSCTDFTELALVGASVTTYQNTALPSSTAYNYRVRAYNSGGNSSYSNSASATTLAPVTPPAAPTSLTATAISTTQIDLAWTDNATTETGFRIERCTGTTCSNFVEVATVGVNATTYSSTSLAATTGYNYRVRAYNDGGNSGYSNSSAATTLTPTVNPPAAPTSLTATAASSSQINLTWVDNASDETGFKIERCLGLTCVDFAEITTVAANVTTYQNTSLASETGYNYRVRAYNTGGNSGYSNSQAATTLGTAPAAPTVLTATAVSSSQINLSWTDNATNELGFLIERCTGASCVNFVEFSSTTTNITTYQNTGLASSTVYTYRLRAWNATGTSAYTNSAAATTLAPTITPPAAPTSMIATAISTSVIDLSWTDNATTETGFSVEGCTGASCTNFLEIGTFGANITLVNANNLAQGTAYRFRVRAYNTGGYSAYSNIVTATTQSAIQVLASADNYVADLSTNPNVKNTVYPAAENAVGYNFIYSGTTLTGTLGTASLMKFDVQTQIAGKTIVEAKLLMTEHQAPGDLNGTFKLAAMFTAWNPSTITWSIFTTTQYYNTNMVDFTALSVNTLNFREFNVLGIVQSWANGSFVNNGFVMFDPDPTNPGFATFQILSFASLEVYNNPSYRPQLYIRYR